MKLIPRGCPLCGAESARTVWTHAQTQFYADDVACGAHVDVTTVQCSNCFAIFQNPAPTPAQQIELFSQAGMSYGSAAGRHEEQIEWLSARGLLNEQDLVLDIGCYDGAFLSKMPDWIRRSGLDIDQLAIERAKMADPRGRYVWASFENLALGDLEPQTVTLFHVIEHVLDPIALLERLRAQVSPECNLIIEAPILENARIADINGFFSVQHMTHFTRNSLERVITHSGWQIVEWFEVPDYNGTRVVCRPGPPANEIGPKWSDVTQCIDYVARWQASITGALHRAIKAFDCSQTYVWGAGMHTELLFGLGQFWAEIPNMRLVDKDEIKTGRFWRGLEIENPDVLIAEKNWETARVLVSSYSSQGEIVRQLLALGVPRTSIVVLYDKVVRY